MKHVLKYQHLKSGFQLCGKRHAATFYRVQYPWKNVHKPYWVHQHSDHLLDRDVTSENQSFLEEARAEPWLNSCGSRLSPLKDGDRTPWINGGSQRPVWQSGQTQRCGLIGVKVGVYPMWSEEGHMFTCSIVQILDNHVIRWIPPEDIHRYASLKEMRHYHSHHWHATPSWVTQRRWGLQLVGAVTADPRDFSAAWCGLFNEAGVPPKRKISRFLVSPDAALSPGTPLDVRHFRVGDRVDVTGRTVNRGFEGVMKRHYMEGGPALHGSTKFHRKMGSAAGGGGPIIRGKRMPGVDGNRYRTLRSVQILRMNLRHKLLYLRGPVPGPVRSFVQLHDSWLCNRRRELDADPPPMPAFLPELDELYSEEQEEDIYHESVRRFDQPSISYNK